MRNNRFWSSPEKRIEALYSLFASRTDKGGYALTTVVNNGSRQVEVQRWCAGKSIAGLVKEFRAIEFEEHPVQVALVDPYIELMHFPTVAIGGEPKILLIEESLGINFAQPSVWKTAYAAAMYAKEMPCLTPGEQRRFLDALLPYADRY
jgi:hypothetical protein